MLLPRAWHRCTCTSIQRGLEDGWIIKLDPQRTGVKTPLDMATHGEADPHPVVPPLINTGVIQAYTTYSVFSGNDPVHNDIP
jgi:cytosine/adenosine deaminase-related metal-dependent hydrolase